MASIIEKKNKICIMDKKICRICGKIKDLDNFNKSKKMKDCHRNECKECHKKLYVDVYKIRKRNQNKTVKNSGEKICRICKEEKIITDFHIKRGTFDGRRSECKNCIKIIQKKYKEVIGFKEKQKEYDKNRYKEKRKEILERKRDYHIENLEKILYYKKVYRQENKEKIKEWRSDNKERLAELQSNYRERYPHIIAWRSILYFTLKRLNTEKQNKTIILLGYSANQLKEHLEHQFKEGMSWDNHGEWHIDHIKPVTKFSENSNVSEVCALDNLQPLWKVDNLIKGNKF